MIDTGAKESEINLMIYQVRMTVFDIAKFLENLRKISSTYGCKTICFNRDVIAGKKHVESAILHALRAFSGGETIARSIEVEALLYAAGTRQTGLISPFGIHAGVNDCYLCIVPEKQGVVNDLLQIPGLAFEIVNSENWEIIDEEKERRLIGLFQISPQEIEIVGNKRIIDLILERVALLVINR